MMHHRIGVSMLTSPESVNGCNHCHESVRAGCLKIYVYDDKIVPFPFEIKVCRVK
jgi:hypothetical protein